MTSTNGNIFRVTGSLCGEFIGRLYIPLTKASNAELWCFLWSAPKKNDWVNTSLTIVYSTVHSGADQRNIKAPRHWPLWGEQFTGDRWILRTNGQYRGKCLQCGNHVWQLRGSSTEISTSCDISEMIEVLIPKIHYNLNKEGFVRISFTEVNRNATSSVQISMCYANNSIFLSGSPFY